MRGAAKMRCPGVLKEHAYYEALTWWFTVHQIGQGLRERYEFPTELPPKFLALVRKLDDRDWLLPNVSWQDDVDLLGGRVRR